MKENEKVRWKQRFIKVRTFLLSKSIKGFVHIWMKLCKIEFEGLERFCQLAATEKCILMLWHSRSIIVPYILAHYTPHISYIGLVSKSRDGEVINRIILSYPNEKTIRVSHTARFQALLQMMSSMKKEHHILVITPDGPKGPRCEIKPGIAFMALKAQACVVPLNWEAKGFWQLNTWDRHRIPKPFTTIQVSFGEPICFDQATPSLEESQAMLQKHLPKE